MKYRTSFLSIVLVNLAASAVGQTGSAALGNSPERALNLSLPPATLSQSGKTQPDSLQDAARADSRSAAWIDGKRTGEGLQRLPYGTGFESRQHGQGSSSGRGGMGRGH